MTNFINAYKWQLAYLILLCTLGPLSFAWGSVPISFQSIFIFICPFIFKKWDAVLLLVTYLILGAIGFPVFAGFKGGLAVLYGPTSGFLWGFLGVVYALTFFRNVSNGYKIFALLVIAHVLLFVPGLIVLGIQLPETNLASLFIKFLPAIFIKSGIAVFIINLIQKINPESPKN